LVEDEIEHGLDLAPIVAVARAKDERVLSQAIRVRGRPHVAIANFIALLEAVRALERNASVASHMLPHYLGTQASY
jgi:hypothetical protein